MSMDSLECPQLHVEGDTDVYALRELLARHGVSLDKKLGPVVLRAASNDREVLRFMRTTTKSSTKPVGFVIDADIPIADRWRSVCDHLSGLGLEFPETIPQTGYIGSGAIAQARVGVWIMPDNRIDSGRLEHLIKTLVPAEDKLFPLAERSTSEAIDLGAPVSRERPEKAQLHSWLAWQKEPGDSFGRALQKQILRHDSPAALAFVDWFKRLYAEALNLS